MKCDSKPDSVRSKLDSLVIEARDHLESLGYQPGTMDNYQYVWDEFLRFAQTQPDANTFSIDLVDRFLKSCGISEGSEETALTFRQRHKKIVMRGLTEFSLHGCIQRRLRVAEKVGLPAEMAYALSGYEQFCQDHLRSPTETRRTRKRDIVRFFHYLDSHGVTAVKEIQPVMISGFVTSLAQLKPATLAGVASSLRSLLRYLCMQGIIGADLLDHVPRVPVRRDERIPSVWRQKDVDTLLSTVERSSPCGKRDYAILLLAARLGMRAGDIRSLCLDHLLWNQERIEFNQTKGGEPLSLPLTEEIGDALIDYLRHGRPPSQHREVFLRVNAPIEPFGNNNNLHYIITKYRRRAGITLAQRSRRGLHSLRHTTASRLLEQGTPLETISAIMGHLSVETTRIYTKVDVEALRSAAFDPEEVVHE